MGSRRRFLQQCALLASAGVVGSTAGCSTPFGSNTDTPPAKTWPPATAELSGFVRGRFREHGHVVYSIDAKDIRSHRDAMSKQAYEMYTRRFARSELPGLRFEEVSTQLIGGVPAVNAFPQWLMGRVGRQAYSVTLGDFTRKTVSDRLSNQGHDRTERDEVAYFRVEEGVTYAVGEGWVVAGFTDAVTTVIDAHDGEATRYAESDSDFERVVDALGDTTFQYATAREPITRGKPKEGEFVGQVGEGAGYTFTDSGTKLDAVRVFTDGSGMPTNAIENWATAKLVPFDDVSVRSDGRTVRITGSTGKYELPATTPAFVPFLSF